MQEQRKYNLIIWDWNGTLFNDVEWNIGVINKMLAKRNLKTLDSKADYHNVFCFPVVDYYKKLGFDFDKEPFEELAVEFIKLYHLNNTGNSQLCKNAIIVLNEIRSKGIEQIILSASELDNLLSQINVFNINHYFKTILGLSDIYAKSKIDIGRNYIEISKPERAILIGDTIHDFEVANALGVDCLLTANGHSGKKSLLKCGVPVLDDIIQVLNYI